MTHQGPISSRLLCFLVLDHIMNHVDNITKHLEKLDEAFTRLFNLVRMFENIYINWFWDIRSLILTAFTSSAIPVLVKNQNLANSHLFVNSIHISE